METSDNKWHDPQQLLSLHFSFAASRVLSTALQFDFFSIVNHDFHDTKEIAKQASADENGTRLILNALTAHGLLTKNNDNYYLTDFTARYLVKDSDEYVGVMMENDDIWEAWTDLPYIVKNGSPRREVGQKEKGPDFFPKLIQSLHVINLKPAQKTAEYISSIIDKNDPIILDLACGSGVWGLSFAKVNPNTKVVFQDFDNVLDLTKKYVDNFDIATQSDYLPGDLNEIEFREDEYDIAILGNIVHSIGEQQSRQLFKKLRKALKPGGKILILDMIPNEDRSGPVFPIIFALNMLVNTNSGNTYTLSEYGNWLKDAGFSKMDTHDIGSHSPLIIGS